MGNRWCILPMEGWDGTRDGEPSDLTRRRWARFGRSGVPMYAWYAGRGAAPRLLPEVLTPGLVLNALAEAAPATATR